MPDRIRIGILGSGGAARSHAAAYAEMPDVTVNALWNRTRSNAEQLARDLGAADIRVYDDWQEMIEQADIDVISVATPEFLRREPVVMALERGLHVLVEKPFSIRLDDAKAMVEAAEKSDAASAICLNWRYAPGMQTARRGVREGWIGRLLDIQMRWRFPATPRMLLEEMMPWATEEITALGAGGSHDFDKARFLTGSDFVRVTGRVTPFTLSAEPEYISHGAFALIADMTEGVLGTFRLTLTTGQPDWHLVLNGETGTMTVTNEAVVRQLAGEVEATAVDIPAADRTPEGTMVIQHAWNRLIADFIAAVRHGDKDHASVPHLPTLVDGLHTQEVIEAAQIAQREDRWVEIAEMR